MNGQTARDDSIRADRADTAVRKDRAVRADSHDEHTWDRRRSASARAPRPVRQLRDYVAWHRAYDDPDSGMSWRLAGVQRHVHAALDTQLGGRSTARPDRQTVQAGRPVRILSLCAGDGRDVIGVLGARDAAEPTEAVLVELHPDIADQARVAARRAGVAERVQVRTADAGRTNRYDDVVPADIVLLVGIFGNIVDDDLWRTVDAAPALCAPGAVLLWSRGRDRDDRNDEIRRRLDAAGFEELAYETLDTGSRPALGVVRYAGDPQPLPVGPLFSFVR